MILQFSVSNYRCIRSLQTLNLAASSQDKSLPDNCNTSEAPGLAGKRWLKGVALYGANASGKTTILQALAALSDLVENSGKMTDPQDPITQIEPFALCPGAAVSPTAFLIAFVAEGVRYEYRVAATRERIWHESLRAFPKKVEQLWYSRDWNAETETYSWTPERPVGFQRDPILERTTLDNMLFVSKTIASNRKDLDPVFRFFKERLVFLDLSVGSGVNPSYTLNQVEENTSLVPKITELLRHADLGVTNVRAVEKRPPAKDLEELFASLPLDVREHVKKERWMQPELIHRGSKAAEVALPWSLESGGTRRYFSLAGPWLDILSKGYTVCIDELETSLHPIMVRELLRLFFCPKSNPKGAQILFTTHNPLLLDSTLLRRDQVWFTDKDAEGESHLYPLTDYSPRKGESLVRGYLAGRYGAVPFVPAGLLGLFPAVEKIDSTQTERETDE